MSFDQSTQEDVTPLADPEDRPAPPAVLVIFGASGDLTSRKLMPAVERLALRRLLPASFSVVGVARTEMDDEEFLQRMTKTVLDVRSQDEGGEGDDVRHVWEAF